MANVALDAEAIFLAALEESVHERDTFVAQMCASDAALLSQVRALLNAHDQSRGPFDLPPPGVASTLETSVALERPGSLIGPYRLLEQIGEGGMGTVWMVQQQTPVKRVVALKLIKAGMDSTQVIARFEAERQALALMDHANIARVLDAGTTSAGRPYFVMDLVKGVPITKYCDEHHLTLRQRLELFIPVCQAVQHAHQKGIIHRDLKPSNVLVALYDGKPVPKVIDFGVAKAAGQPLTDKTLVTGFGAIVGTLEYMSPEQAEFNQLDIDTRSDIYSLGVLLYELLTGTTPLERGRLKDTGLLELLRSIREDETPRPSLRLSTIKGLPLTASKRGLEPKKLSGLIRDELDWIAMKALEKDRNRRYESASAYAADIERYLHDEPVQACPPSAWYRFRKFARGNKAALATASVIALVVAVAVGVSAALIWRANQDLRREAYFQRITVAHRELLTDVAAALKALRECPEDLRGWEWHYLMRRCLMEPLVIRDKTAVIGVAFSPDGEQLASAGADGAVRIWNSRTGKLILQISGAHERGVCSVVFHPDGKHLASAGADGRVKVWGLTTDPAVKMFDEPCDALRKFGAAYTVAFSSPDGRRLAAGSDGTVTLWDWNNGQPLHAFAGHEHNSIPVAFNHDGRQLATGGRQGQSIWDAETGRLLRSLPAHHLPVSALAFGPGGDQLATASLDRSVKLWNTATGELVHIFVHTGNVLGVAFSPDGGRLVSTGEDKIVRLWDVTTGREVLGLRGHTDSSACVAFSPHGRRLVSASLDGTICVWDATPLRGHEGQETEFAHHGEELRSVAVSPDGAKIVSAGHGGLLKVWDAATGQRLVEIPGYKVIVFSVAWHPDSQHIASAGSDGPQRAVKVWDARSGGVKVVIQPEGENFAVPFQAVAFSPGPEGRYLVTGNQNGAVEVWDARTGVWVGQLGTHDREIRGVVFSPDGKHLASASGDGRVKFWDATRLDKEQEPRLPPLRARVPVPCLNVAFSPDSQRLATGGTGNTVKIWDVQTGKELRTLPGHNGDVYTVAFSPSDNGRWLASGGEDSTVKIWDSRTGEEVLTFRGHSGLVSTLAFSRDGRRLYSGSRDKTLKAWDLTQLDKLPNR